MDHHTSNIARRILSHKKDFGLNEVGNGGSLSALFTGSSYVFIQSQSCLHVRPGVQVNPRSLLKRLRRSEGDSQSIPELGDLISMILRILSARTRLRLELLLQGTKISFKSIITQVLYAF